MIHWHAVMFVDHVCWVGVSEDLKLNAKDFLLFGGCRRGTRGPNRVHRAS